MLWVELDPAIDASRLYRAGLRGGISTLPGPVFSPTGRYRHAIRLNFAVQWSKRIEDAIAELGRLARSQLG